MKKIKIYILMILLTGFVISCSNYLDEPKPTTKVDDVVVFASGEASKSALTGIYRRLRARWDKTTDVGGLYSIYFARVNKGITAINAGGWYKYEYNHQDRESAYRRPRETWRFLYYLINQTNVIIKNTKEASYSEEDKTKIETEARALRAFFYFQLGLEYCIAYTYKNTESAPPIYDAPTIEGKGMSTLKALYEFILEDLDFAMQYMDENRLDKSYLNLDVVKGIKVRVLMTMNENWNEIQTLSKSIYGSVDDALDGDYKDGFDDINRSDWIWGMLQTLTQTNYYFAAPAAFTSPSGYGNVFISKTFAESFSETDVRNTFKKNEAFSEDNPRLYSTNKYVFQFDSDILIMRKAEFLLADIEASYHLGDETTAHNLLYEMQQKRDPSAVKSTNTGNDFLEEILLERRKELYFELGVDWFDAKRLGRGLDRSGSNHPKEVDISSNDVRFELKIPDDEIRANPNIDKSVNENR